VQEGFGLIPVERAHPDPDDWETTSAVLKTHPGAWMVLDGYHFDPSYQRCVREAGHPLLVIDDTAHLERYWADVILNQNLHAETLQYNADSNTQFLLGTHYVLLRKEFLQLASWRREDRRNGAPRLLVTLGGTDPHNVTLKVVHALRYAGSPDLHVLLAAPDGLIRRPEFREAVVASHAAIEVRHDIVDMPGAMQWADLAVSAGGSTCWEMAFMQLPSVLIATEHHQMLVICALDEGGAAVALGESECISAEEVAAAIDDLVRDKRRRADMGGRGRKVVDGFGSERVAEMLWTHVACMRSWRAART
jgi:spore coat polysaccharide biosynthesis predicted glycosyltransferase SpsG